MRQACVRTSSSRCKIDMWRAGMATTLYMSALSGYNMRLYRDKANRTGNDRVLTGRSASLLLACMLLNMRKALLILGNNPYVQYYSVDIFVYNHTNASMENGLQKPPGYDG